MMKLFYYSFQNPSVCCFLVKIGHLAFMDGSEIGVDLVLVQTFLLFNVNQVILMLTSIFQGQFP